jgi:hypothetical protein
MALYPRRWYSSKLPLREPQILESRFMFRTYWVNFSVQRQTIVTEVLCGFPQFCQDRFLKLASSLPSTSFAIHYSLINLSAEDVYSQ